MLGLSSEVEPNWNDMIFLAKLIPRILHNINRVCYVFGGHIQYPVTEVTYTHISNFALSQLREADAIANEVMKSTGTTRQIAQMPIVLIPIHFDRDPANKVPSVQRSVVLRPFITNDFMTGVPAIPGSERLPMPVSIFNFFLEISIFEKEIFAGS